MGNATPHFWEALSSSEGLRVGAWRNARASTSAKTLLLCLSGVGTWSVIYRELLQCDWPESMDVCALDLPGQGCSDKTKRGAEFLLDFQVAIVLEILQTLRRELRFDVLHIVAHGTSAPLALQVASEPEACVAGISLLNPIVLNAAWPESPRPPASRVQFLRWLNALVEGDTNLAMAVSAPYPDTGHCQGILGALQRLFSIGTSDVTVPASQCAIPTSLHVSKLFEASIDPKVQAICSHAAINLHPGLSYLMGLPASGRRWVPNLTIHET